MKKQFKGFISGVVITSVLFTNILPVLAKTGTEQLNATYNNIKMYLNGEKINSPAGEPFILNGTTYVPLRVVSESLGADVTFDSSTNSIYLSTQGTGGVNLEEISPIVGNWSKNSENKKVSSFGKIVNPSSRFLIGINYENKESMLSEPIVYNLNGDYDKFTCTLSNSYDYDGNSYKMYIYADDKLIYESPNYISGGTKVDVDLDITNTNKLKFIAEKYEQEKYTRMTFDDVVMFEPTLWK